VTLNYKLSNLPPPKLSWRLLGQGWHTALPDCLICLACSTAKSIQQIRGVSLGTKKQVCGPDTLQASNQEVGEDIGPRPINSSCVVIGRSEPFIKSQDFQFEGWLESIISPSSLPTSFSHRSNTHICSTRPEHWRWTQKARGPAFEAFVRSRP
jgi:hypothetical protein